jgi:hypothetical protein
VSKVLPVKHGKYSFSVYPINAISCKQFDEFSPNMIEPIIVDKLIASEDTFPQICFGKMNVNMSHGVSRNEKTSTSTKEFLTPGYVIHNLR